MFVVTFTLVALLDACAASPSDVSPSAAAAAGASVDDGREGEGALTVDGGGHTWPGGEDVVILGHTTQDISATEYMGAFFAAHPMP